MFGAYLTQTATGFHAGENIHTNKKGKERMGGKMVQWSLPCLTLQYPLRLHRGGHPASRATLAWHTKTSEPDDSKKYHIGKRFILIGVSSGSGAERRQASE